MPDGAAVEQPGWPSIELRLDDANHLFDPFDPLPMPTRDLSPNAEDFIVDWARELPPHQPLRIALHVNADNISVDPEHLKNAVKTHFAARAERMRGERNQLLGIGQLSLVIGLTVLAACIFTRQLLVAALGHSALADFLGEALVILGSVANWRPLEIFLYNWWPLDRRRRLFERLALARVDVIPERNGQAMFLTPVNVAGPARD
jgi:hypothetical protein